MKCKSLVKIVVALGIYALLFAVVFQNISMKILGYPLPTSGQYYVERLMSPGYGSCLKCGRPWKYAVLHSTYYWGSNEGHKMGCFPLCQPCWEGMSISNRIPYYNKLITMWHDVDKETAKAIIDAVQQGG